MIVAQNEEQMPRLERNSAMWDGTAFAGRHKLVTSANLHLSFATTTITTTNIPLQRLFVVGSL